MLKIEPNARPYITDKTYLRHLTDIGVFEKQLDAWAFAVAYSLKNKLPIGPDQAISRHEDVTEVDHLDQSTLNVLLMALEAVKPELAQEDSTTVIRELSSLASAGLAAIRERTEGRGVNEIYEFLLQCA